MYIFFTKNKDSVIAQRSNLKQDLFNNTDNIYEVLSTYNAGIIVKEKIEEYSKIIENNENMNIVVESDILKKDYLELRKKDIEQKLLDLLRNGTRIYSSKKENSYIHNDKFFGDLNNKLKLIDFYLEIRKALINKDDLNFKFSRDEDQSKKLKFINLCVVNYKDPDKFIEEFVKQDEKYKEKQIQKKLI